ncbi:hypothetical protein LTR85_009089 [Meristemomyces frigidus]|nr:hypothetical protein LTR85_009089 [Meristemomyces frigidus]
MWKDIDGTIVAKRPDISDQQNGSATVTTSDSEPAGSDVALMSPPASLSSSSANTLTENQKMPVVAESQWNVAPNEINLPYNSYAPIGLADSFWETPARANQDMRALQDSAPYGDVFNPDTASSFNMPFTIMNNYNWLFDINLDSYLEIGNAAIFSQAQQGEFSPFPGLPAFSEGGDSMEMSFDNIPGFVQTSMCGSSQPEPRRHPTATSTQPQPAPLHTSTSDVLGASGFEAGSIPAIPIASNVTSTEAGASTLATPVCIHDVLRPQICANAAFGARPELWILQTILLVECFGKSRAGQKQHDMSHLFHGLLINLIRRSDCQTVKPETLQESTGSLIDSWMAWVEAEQKKRLALLCFMWDVQHALLFCQSLCMSAFELRSTLPCDQSLWEASSAEQWQDLCKRQKPSPLFLTVLKTYLSAEGTHTSGHLNALSHTILLHGLMSVSWDMKRRDQTSLGFMGNDTVLGRWQSRMAAAYDAWKAAFDEHTTSMAKSAGSHSSPAVSPEQQRRARRELAIFSTAYTAIYHAAHVILHAEFLDLQIYADEAVAAADEDDDEMIWDAKAEMQALIGAMIRLSPDQLTVAAPKKRKTQTVGLTAVIVKHLSTIRWAVVHEGMIVLKGLVPWRLVNQDEALV